MSFPLINPKTQFFDSSGSPLSSGSIEFRSPSTNDLIDTYPTADDADAQTNANDNPLTLDASGRASVYLEDGVKYKVILKDADGVTFWTEDDVRSPLYSSDSILGIISIGDVIYPTTAEETAASVVPTSTLFPVGDIRRYGATEASARAAIVEAISVADQDKGGVVIIPPGKWICDAAITVPATVSFRGAGKSYAEVTSGLGITPQGSEINFSGSNGFLCDEGFNHFEDIVISGVVGEYYGLKAEAPDVSGTNLAIKGFTDGVGLWLENHFRAGFVNLDISACGIGLLFETVVNAVTFTNIKVENCTVGWFTLSGTYHNIMMTGTIEGCEEGKKSTSFPTTALLTASSEVLTDLAVAQSALEGGIIVFGVNGAVGVYTEACSLCLVYYGTNCAIEMSGSYINDQITLLGTNQVTPDHLIFGARARMLDISRVWLSTDNARSGAAIDINSDRPHSTKGIRVVHTDGSTYTGTLYSDSINTDVEYLSNTRFTNASGLELGARFRSYAVPPDSTVVSASAAIDIDGRDGSVFFIDLDEDTTITGSNFTDGQYLEIHILQDATGGWDVTFNSAFRQSWSNTGNTANLKSCIAFRYRTSDSRWHQIGEQVTYHS